MSSKLITIALISLIGILAMNPLPVLDQANAQSDLLVEFEATPLFNEANFLLGQSITRWAKVTNNSEETQRIVVETINYPGSLDFDSVPIDDLSRVLLIIIREKGGGDLYGGLNGEKTLFNFYQDGQIYLSDVDNSSTQEYEFEISFPSDIGDEWQNKITHFDILIGFQGTEGGIDSGSSDFLSPGLSIQCEQSFQPSATSVTINWLTSYKSTSRVVYSTIPGIFDFYAGEPNYGYEFCTDEYDTPASTDGVTGHSTTITGLDPNTIYYYRTVSHVSGFSSFAGYFFDAEVSLGNIFAVGDFESFIYVPDDYSTIQAAVDAANSGNTIIVRDGTYTENIDVDKPDLIIKSENGADTTIVQAADPNDHVFEVTADYVNINGFTIKGTGISYKIVELAGVFLKGHDSNISNNSILDIRYGIGVYLSSGNTIMNNNLSSNSWGIRLWSSHDNVIIDNNISHNKDGGVDIGGSNNIVRNNSFVNCGLYISDAHDNFVTNNKVNGKPLVYLEGISDQTVADAGQVILVRAKNITVEALDLSNVGVGVQLYKTESSKIANNVIKSNNSGIDLRYSNNNVIAGNIVNSNKGYGIFLLRSSNNEINHNNISQNYNGIALWHSSNGNELYQNNFINNTKNIQYYSTNTWNSPEEIIYTYNGNQYTNYLGNYWSDYTGSDGNGDGTGDTPYSIDSDADNYPLMQPFENYVEGEIPPTNQYYVNAHSVYFPSGDYSVELMTNDPNQTIQSVSVTGPGIVSSIFLEQGIHSLHPNQWWSNPNVDLSSDPPDLPLVYIFTITDKAGATYEINDSVQSYVGNFATNLSPEGNQTNDSSLVFSWTGVDIEAVKYKVELYDEDWNRKWDSPIITNTSVIYNGPVLTSGGYQYFVAVFDEYGNSSLAYQTFQIGNPPENQPPSCTIELQNDNGDKIDKINVGEIFNIYVGDSTGDISQVRFLSDELQDGEADKNCDWTEFNWNESGDTSWGWHWDHSNKKMEWSFDSPGEKEVWVEVKDSRDQIKQCFGNISANSIQSSISTKFKTDDFVRIIDYIEYYDYKIMAQPIMHSEEIISLCWLTEWSYGGGQILASRSNGIFADGHYWWHIKFVNWADATYIGWVMEDAIEMNQPPIALFEFSNNNPKTGEEIIFDASDSYDPDGEIIDYYWECKDSNNKTIFSGHTESPEIFYYWKFYLWQKSKTYCIKLKVTDNKGVTSEISKSSIKVDRKIFGSPGEKKIRENEIKKIKEALDIPNFCSSENYYSKECSFFRDDLLVGAILNKPVANEEILKKGVNPQEAKDFTYKTRLINVIQDMKLVDSVANRSFDIDGVIPAYFDNMAETNAWAEEIPAEGLELTSEALLAIGDALLKHSLEINGSGVGIGPVLMIPKLCEIGVGLGFLDKIFYRKAFWLYFWDRYNNGSSSNEAFALIPKRIIDIPFFNKYNKVFQSEEGKQYLESLWNEYSPNISREGGLSEQFKENLEKDLRKILFLAYERYKFEPLYQEVILKSPGELRIYDSQGNVTGLVDEKIKEEIPNSMYDAENKTVVIFNPVDTYRYEVVGIEKPDEDTYGLTITSVENGEATIFHAVAIPTTSGEVHQYTIDWNVLSQGGEGTTLKIDLDGDGDFEETIITGDTFQTSVAPVADEEPNQIAYTAPSGGGGLPQGLSISGNSIGTSAIGENTATVSWLTSLFSTSQIIYSSEDETHNFDSDNSLNYGYAHSTQKTSTKATGHYITLYDLYPGTIYYYRCISASSPDVIGPEHSFITLGEKIIIALGDINRDGKVDILDFNLLIVNWGDNPENQNADFNSDGKLDVLDFNTLIVNWTKI